MGSYTESQRFYKSDPSEIINVDQDLNYNLRRADVRVRALVEYQKTDVPSISAASISKDIGFKWYKTYTNSIWVYRNDREIWQDPNAIVEEWFTSGITWESGYGPASGDINNVAYSIFNNMVRLRGRVALNSGQSQFPLNTNTNFMTLPTSARPLVQKYFTLYGGNGTSDFQCFRLFIPQSSASDQRLEFCKYGGASENADENYLDLNDVWYALDT